MPPPVTPPRGRISQQPAKVQFALHRTARELNRVQFLSRGHWQCPIIKTLMRTPPVAKGYKAVYDIAKVIDAEADEVIESFQLDRLHVPFGEGIQIRLAWPDPDDL